jgi:hypothetical protein
MGKSAPSSKNNHIRLKLGAVVEQDCVFCESLDLWPTFQLDLSVCDKLAGARICSWDMV